MRAVRNVARRAASTVMAGVTLWACGGGGGAGGPGVPPPGAPGPSVVIAASASSAYAGQPVVLTWSSQGATSCTGSGAWSGPQSLSGSVQVPTATPGTYQYTLTCDAGSSQATDMASVAVTSPQVVLSTAFTPLAQTIPTSEGGPAGVTDFWPGKDFVTTALGYGPAMIQRVEICLSATLTTASCSAQPSPTGPLSDAMLAAMDRGLGRFAGSGKRLLVRFVYNMGPVGSAGRDVPVGLILTHIAQVAPILARHQDLVFALESGFIGTWGEWHDSTSGNDAPAARKAVLDAELAAFGGRFPILVRYPQLLVDYLGAATASASFGLHDDYFLSSDDDGGTWSSSGPGGGSYGRATLQGFAEATAATSPFVGEFGSLAPALQTCSNLDAYAARYGLQALSLNIEPGSVAAELVSEGCALSFLNRVGTRIEIEEARVLGAPTAGANLHLALTLSNTGYGRVMRARPASLVVLDGAAAVATIPIPLASLDLRTLVAGAAPTTFQVDVPLPIDVTAALRAGTLGLALSLPEPAPSLAALVAYALPLNSIDASGVRVFDPASGLNFLHRPGT